LCFHLNVSFGSLHAVNDVSLSLRAGDLLGLIGPNGAGKTTLLRAIATLQSLDSGALRLFDDPLSADYPDLLRHVGFTPDNPPVYEQLTVRDFCGSSRSGTTWKVTRKSASISGWRKSG